MAEDLISKIAHNKKKREAIRSQANKDTTPQPTRSKIHKTVAVSMPMYTRLKILSAKKNVQIKELVAMALKYAFKNNIYHE